MSRIKLTDLLQERRHRYPMEPKREGHNDPENWQFAKYIGKEADLMETKGKAAEMDEDNCAYLPENELHKFKPEEWADNAYSVPHKDLEYYSVDK